LALSYQQLILRHVDDRLGLCFGDTGDFVDPASGRFDLCLCQGKRCASLGESWFVRRLVGAGNDGGAFLGQSWLAFWLAGHGDIAVTFLDRNRVFFFGVCRFRRRFFGRGF
jgi:hypothetical protein